MNWIKRVKKPIKELPTHQSSIEIVTHHEATEETIKEAKQANEVLKNLLNENGFTLKIVLAAAGRPKPKGKL